jgi:hypothetical protein
MANRGGTAEQRFVLLLDEAFLFKEQEWIRNK